MKNSLHWFPPGAVRSEAGLGRLCEQRGTLGAGALQGGQGRPLALQLLPFLLLDGTPSWMLEGHRLHTLSSYCHFTAFSKFGHLLP